MSMEDLFRQGVYLVSVLYPCILLVTQCSAAQRTSEANLRVCLPHIFTSVTGSQYLEHHVGWMRPLFPCFGVKVNYKYLPSSSRHLTASALAPEPLSIMKWTMSSRCLKFSVGKIEIGIYVET